MPRTRRRAAAAGVVSMGRYFQIVRSPALMVDKRGRVGSIILVTTEIRPRRCESRYDPWTAAFEHIEALNSRTFLQAPAGFLMLTKAELSERWNVYTFRVARERRWDEDFPIAHGTVCVHPAEYLDFAKLLGL